MKAQDDFPAIELDALHNLISVCPLCHKQVHYGNKSAKEEVFWIMYAVRKHDLLEIGFTKKLMDQIFTKYYL